MFSTAKSAVPLAMLQLVFALVQRGLKALAYNGHVIGVTLTYLLLHLGVWRGCECGGDGGDFEVMWL